MLPHLQQLRSLSKLLRLQARLLVMEGNFEGAANTLQTGTMLALHLNDEPFLVQSLVSASIEASLLKVVEDWLAQPGAPNLYWALTELPAPFVNAKDAMATERAALYMQFPAMRDAANGHISAAQWTSMLKAMLSFTAAPNSSPSTSFTEVGLALVSSAALPQAKQFLADDGMPAAEIKQLEPYQAIAAFWIRDYERTIQDMTKWYSLPYAQARGGIAKTEAAFVASKGTLTTPFRAIMPALGRAMMNMTKLDRRIAALRVIEAIRAYAAGHDGQLPATLYAITEVPIPIDPITGKPFKYTSMETGFTLEGIADGLSPRDGLRYEVKVVVGNAKP